MDQKSLWIIISHRLLIFSEQIILYRNIFKIMSTIER